MRRIVMVSVAAMSMATASQAADKIYSSAEAIALAKTTPAGRSGEFEMTVVATGKTLNGVFLNSTADYRGDDNLTFRLRPIVAAELAKKYGAPMEEYLKGKHIVVKGKVVDEPIANMLYGRVRSLNRYQHQVAIDHPEQLISVGG